MMPMWRPRGGLGRAAAAAAAVVTAAAPFAGESQLFGYLAHVVAGGNSTFWKFFEREVE